MFFMNFYFYTSKIISPLIIPSNFLIFALIIFFYFGIFKNINFFKKVFYFIFFSFSLIAILPIGNRLTYHVLEKNFFEVEFSKDIDYIFVPAGGEDRIITAMKLKNKYNLENVKIIYSTGRASINKDKSIDPEEIFTKNLIPHFKINSDDIIFLPEARNTSENFLLLNNYLTKMNMDDAKILLITHGYHIKRCLIFSKKYNFQIEAYPSLLTSKSYSSGLINAYQEISIVSNLQEFDLFIKEMISTVFAIVL